MSLTDKAKKTFCPLAWVHSFVNLEGTYQLCCTSEEFDNNIRYPDNKKVKVTDDISPMEVMNLPMMKEIRNQMLTGEWPEMCKRCEVTEKLGGISRRNIEIDNYKSIQEQILSTTKENGEIQNEIKSADYRLGNICNLQCRMCNPRSTKLWLKDWNEMKPDEEKYPESFMSFYKKFDWANDPKLLSEFRKKANSLNHLHFAGGEPLIVPQMVQILQECVDQGISNKITLTYNTNITILPPKVLDLWKEFKEVKILASIDAFGELNDYIRPPSKWDIVDKNLKYLDKNHKQFNISEILVSTTVQVLNIRRLNELIDYLKGFDFVLPLPNLINLYVPRYYQTTILPKQQKEEITKILKKTRLLNVNRIESGYEYLVENIDQAINFMNAEDNSSWMTEFKTFQDKFDSKKGLSINDHCPELQDL